MKTPEATNSEVDSRTVKALRWKIRVLMIIPWPIFAYGLWCVMQVDLPPSRDLSIMLYPAGIFSTVYGLSLYMLNRAIVYSRRIPRRQGADRVLFIVAVTLFCIMAAGLLGMVFFIMAGFPYSIGGVVLILLAFFRWRRFSTDTSIISGSSQ